MKILMINSVCGIKSTGRICTDLACELEKRDHEVVIAYGRGSVPEQHARFAHRIGADADVRMHGCLARAFDASGLGSKKATADFIEWVKSYDPDVIHLHNIHGYYINVQLLFNYLRNSNKKIIWTLHDCWPFTGHCCYFDYAGCNKWRTQCHECPQKHDYPSSVLVDRSKANYEEKKFLFTGLNDLTLVTPSQWLSSLVKESFLKDYHVYAIPNWVNTAAFVPMYGDVRERYAIGKKHIVLGVASVWDRRKGLDAFLDLDHMLGEDYQIVLVGLSEKQLKKLPKTIIGISHTSSVHELAELYTAADVFVNPTYEDNYPSTNLEAIACGTPVISFDVGGSGESAALYGIVVRERSIGQLTEAIKAVSTGKVRLDKPNIDEYNKNSINSYLRLYEE